MEAFASWLLSPFDKSLLVFDSFLAFTYDELPQAHLVYFPSFRSHCSLLSDVSKNGALCILSVVLFSGLLSGVGIRKTIASVGLIE